MLTLPVALPFIRNETQLKMLRLAANPIQLDWIMTIPILLILSKHYLAITAHVLWSHETCPVITKHVSRSHNMSCDHVLWSCLVKTIWLVITRQVLWSQDMSRNHEINHALFRVGLYTMICIQNKFWIQIREKECTLASDLDSKLLNPNIGKGAPSPLFESKMDFEST